MDNVKEHNICRLSDAAQEAIEKSRVDCLERHTNRLEQCKKWLNTHKKAVIRKKLTEMKETNPVEAKYYRDILNQLNNKHKK